MIDATLKLVKDGVVFVQVAQLWSQMLVNVHRRDRLAIHVDIPKLHREVVTRENVATITAKLDVANARDDFRKEASLLRRLGEFKKLAVRVAHRVLP